jgi:hypothetical protein
MPMDPQLAAIYGTNADETDVEKLAAAKLAEELADDEEVDPAELSDEQAEQLAQQVLAEEAGEGEEVEEPEEEEEQPKRKAKAPQAEEEEEETEEEDEETEKTSGAEDEAQEKLAEADYLGRVMAHAYTQELRKIASAQEKTAGRFGDAASKAWGGAKRGAGASWEHVKKHKKKYIGGAAGAAAAGGAGGYALSRRKKKGKGKTSAAEPTALDVLAERRALEILRENGIEPEQEQQEKQSAAPPEMEALQGAVEQRAYAMLQQAGYIQQE